MRVGVETWVTRVMSASLGSERRLAQAAAAQGAWADQERRYSLIARQGRTGHC